MCVTLFIAILTLLQWFGTESAISPRSAVLGMWGAHRRGAIAQGRKTFRTTSLWF